jgi:hypothetical protein
MIRGVLFIVRKVGRYDVDVGSGGRRRSFVRQLDRAESSRNWDIEEKRALI